MKKILLNMLIIIFYFVLVPGFYVCATDKLQRINTAKHHTIETVLEKCNSVLKDREWQEKLKEDEKALLKDWNLELKETHVNYILDHTEENNHIITSVSKLPNSAERSNLPIRLENDSSIDLRSYGVLYDDVMMLKTEHESIEAQISDLRKEKNNIEALIKSSSEKIDNKSLSSGSSNGSSSRKTSSSSEHSDSSSDEKQSVTSSSSSSVSDYERLIRLIEKEKTELNNLMRDFDTTKSRKGVEKVEEKINLLKEYGGEISKLIRESERQLKDNEMVIEEKETEINKIKDCVTKSLNLKKEGTESFIHWALKNKATIGYGSIKNREIITAINATHVEDSDDFMFDMLSSIKSIDKASVYKDRDDPYCAYLTLELKMDKKQHYFKQQRVGTSHIINAGYSDTVVLILGRNKTKSLDVNTLYIKST